MRLILSSGQTTMAKSGNIVCGRVPRLLGMEPLGIAFPHKFSMDNGHSLALLEGLFWTERAFMCTINPTLTLMYVHSLRGSDHHDHGM